MLGDALALAEPGGFVRIFIDEGPPMAELLSEALAQGLAPGYTDKLLAAFEVAGPEAQIIRPAPCSAVGRSIESPRAGGSAAD